MSLKRSHPAPVFVHLALVMILTMLVKNRAVLALSLAAGLLTQTLHEKIKAKTLLWNLLFSALIIILNPLFNQNGSPLFYIGRLRITEEALLAGLDIALMILAVIHWFILFNHLLSADKFIYLFGGALPNTALLVSMGLRFVPLFSKQGERIRQAQRALGLHGEGFFNRVKSRMKTFVALISWSLENALDAALAMRARGFGSAKRTNYGPYRFRGSDLAFLIVSISAFIVAISPHCRVLGAALFFFGGAILEMKEKLKWHWLRSKI